MDSDSLFDCRYVLEIWDGNRSHEREVLLRFLEKIVFDLTEL